MKNKKIYAILALLLAFLTLSLYTVFPQVCALISKKGSITLNISDSTTGTPLKNAAFRIYLFAEAYEIGNGIGYDYVIPYDECKMDMDNLQDAYLPIHLTHFAYTNSLPYTEKVSDEKGHIVFDDLVPGVYLVLPSGSIENYFMPSPFVINIPLYDNENKNWIYDINATPKMKIHSNSEENSTTYISVKKVWESDVNHPESVTVSLLCDFKSVETVELNEENSWSFRWENLSKKHTWSVVEAQVPDGYTVSYEVSSNTVVIINKKNKDEATTSPADRLPEDEETTTAPEELIYTGQLNWPIPVFTIAGLLLFSLGWALLNLGKKENS